MTNQPTINIQTQFDTKTNFVLQEFTFFYNKSSIGGKDHQVLKTWLGTDQDMTRGAYIEIGADGLVRSYEIVDAEYSLVRTGVSPWSFAEVEAELRRLAFKTGDKRGYFNEPDPEGSSILAEIIALFGRDLVPSGYQHGRPRISRSSLSGWVSKSRWQANAGSTGEGYPCFVRGR